MGLSDIHLQSARFVHHVGVIADFLVYFRFVSNTAGVIEADSTNGIETFSFFPTFGDRSVLLDGAVFYVHLGEVKGAFWGSQ